MSAIDRLREQQAKFKPRNPAYTVALQLMDICRDDPDSAALVEKDLDAGMSIDKAAGEIRKYADANHGAAREYCVPPDKAEEILRKFYGLPERGEQQPQSDGVTLDLNALLG